MERAEAVLGSAVIPFVIRRSDRRQTVTIRIEATGEVLVSAPSRAMTSQLQEIVVSRGPWILQKLRERDAYRVNLLGDADDAPRRRFVAGDRFLYLGEALTLALSDSASAERATTQAEHDADTKTLWVRGVLLSDPKPVRAALVVWFAARAHAHLLGQTAAWAERLDLKPSQVMVVDQKRRWGSCSHDGVIRLNWRIIGAPPDVIDYLIAHELTHLRHHDHSPRFWNALAAHMPDHKSRRATLKRLGHLLMW